jgi:hypothetical protein
MIIERLIIFLVMQKMLFILNYGGPKDISYSGSGGKNYNSSPNIARKIETSPWKSWYAWRPVQLHGEWVWFEWVFRRCINTYVDMDNWKRYEYGNIFDVLGE